MTQEATDNMQKIADIRKAMQSGELNYDDAFDKAKPIIDRINARGKELAKKHGMRPKMITFSELMR